MYTERIGERRFPWSTGESQLEPGEELASSLGDGFHALRQAFSLRSTILGVVLALAIYLGNGIIGALVPVFFLTEAVGWTKELYTQVQGGPAVLCGVAGAACGGFLVDRFGAKRMIALGSILNGLGWLAFYVFPTAWQTLSFVIPLLCFTTFASSVMSVGLFALFMGISWAKIGGTQFTAYMALLNLSTSIGTKIVGRLEAAIGTEQVFLTVPVCAIISLLPLILIDEQETSRVLGGAVSADPDVAPTHL